MNNSPKLFPLFRQSSPCTANEQQHQDWGMDIRVDASQNAWLWTWIVQCSICFNHANLSKPHPFGMFWSIMQGNGNLGKEISMILHHRMMGCLSNCSHYILLWCSSLYIGKTIVQDSADQLLGTKKVFSSQWLDFSTYKMKTLQSCICKVIRIAEDRKHVSKWRSSMEMGTI